MIFILILQEYKYQQQRVLLMDIAQQVYFTYAKPFLEENIVYVKHHGLIWTQKAEAAFLDYSQNIHFGWFCIIYSILFLMIGRYFSRTERWQAQNKQLKTFKQKIKAKAYAFLFSIPILSSIIQKKFEKALDKQQKEISQQFKKKWDPKRCNTIPDDGMTEDNIKKRILEWKNKEKTLWDTGKVSGAFYVQEQQHMIKMSDFAAPYMYQNPLHLGTYKQLNKMENQLLLMTSDLLTSKGNTYYGSVTTGGSESLILALYTHKKFYSHRNKPNVVAPVTVHAAVDKGCFYLNIQLRKAKLNSNYQVDINHVKQLIDSNTILIFGSVPNYPHGIVDPIGELAKIATKKNVGLHVDGCLGSFIGCFDQEYKDCYSLDREGVTSVSLDHHKFALAPKGVSTIFYKTRQLRHCQYYVNTQWPGGLYQTNTMPGSRSGFASAAAWYSLTQITKKGFKNNAKLVTSATRKCAQQLRKNNDIQVFGDPKLCVVSFTTKDPKISPLSLSDYLNREKNWNVSPIHKPLGIHISVTLANCRAVQQELPKDVEAGIKYLRNNQTVKQTISSAFYGASAKIPTDGMQIQALKYLLSATMK